jgi:hypothetical protein
MTNIRNPEIVYTDGYAEGELQYSTDSRFVPDTVTAQASGSMAAPRDVASFIQINGADPRQQHMSILMTTPVWSRVQYDIVMDASRTTFQYFV